MSGDVGEDVNTPEKLFLDQLDTIERAIRFACRRGGLRDDEAEDFGSYVKLKLIENEYAVIRKYERRASFRAFISVVVQRMLLDYRIGQWGKWHASAEAKRLGEPAMTIEAMLYRDGRTIDEMLPVLIRRWPDLTRRAVEVIAGRLPQRTPRTRLVQLDPMSDALSSFATGEETACASQRAEVAERMAGVVREAIGSLNDPDRLIFRLRYEGGLSVADISRTLQIDQKPLYRRLQRVLALLRQRLEAAGITATDAAEVLTTSSTDLDFGFGSRAPAQSSGSEGDEA